MALSEEHKKKVSEGRKKWLKENPDKHPWRSHNKFKSEPCEKAKEFLRSLGISFIEEFDPQIEGRNFSIDIALPEKKIAIEINGNQHYEKTGELKPYYKEREMLLESNGWVVYEIHYSACFKLEKWADFVNQLKNSPVKVEFDYFNYVPKEKKKWFCVDCGIVLKRNCKKCIDCRPLRLKKTKKFCISCGNKHESKTNFCRTCKSEPNFKKTNMCVCGEYKHYQAKRCLNCAKLKSRKVERPSKEELDKLVMELPLTKIGKQFGVSDNAVRKWCKTYGITEFPNNSYRQKQFHSKK